MYKKIAVLAVAVLFLCTIHIALSHAQEGDDEILPADDGIQDVEGSETDQADAAAQYEIGWRKATGAETKMKQFRANQKNIQSERDYRSANGTLVQLKQHLEDKYNADLGTAPLSDQERQDLGDAQSNFDKAKIAYDPVYELWKSLKYEKKEAIDIMEAARQAYENAGGNSGDLDKLAKQWAEQLAAQAENTECPSDGDGWN